MGRVKGEHGLHRILVLHEEGANVAAIAAALNCEDYRTPAGQRWRSSNVARAIADVAQRTNVAGPAPMTGTG
jgi:hypothetical protein